MKLECFFGNRDDRFAATGSRQSVSRHRLTDGFEQRPNRAPSPGGTQHFRCSNAQLVTAHVLHGRCRYHRPHPFTSYTAAAFFYPPPTSIPCTHTHTHTHLPPACRPTVQLRDIIQTSMPCGRSLGPTALLPLPWSIRLGICSLGSAVMN